MSAPGDRVPFLLWLAVRLLPADVRTEVLGDLLEHWWTDVRGRPWPARALWLARQPIAAAISRLRFRGAGTRAGGVSARRRWGLGFSWLDVKLGLRMMRKHPGVTAVIVFALMLGIPASLAPHHLIDSSFGVSPPFDEGERVLALIPVGPDAAPLRLGDYERLTERLTTFESIGAAISDDINVITFDDGLAQGERGAFLTASSFAIARVPPLMGRVLVPADEAEGAPDVLVIGHDFWRERLGGAPDVVGTTLRIAGVPTTVVGVMPDGFSLPSTERFWLPLRLRSIAYQDGLGPPVQVFGRLADGVSAGEARAEVSAVGGRSAPVGADARDALRVDAAAFSALAVGEPRGIASVLLFAAQAVPLVFLLITCGNVGILLLARTAGRTGEVAVRTALGASRARIVGQLFVEALLLALVATGLGLLALEVVIGRIEPLFTLPFWLDFGVGPELVTKALTLAVLSAVIGGVVPALRATGADPQRTLQGAGGGATLRFGPLVGVLIVVEVGLGVSAFFAGGIMGHLFRPNPGESIWTPEAGRFLAASISAPGPPRGATAEDRDAHRVRLAATQEALARRLAAEPGVRGAAFSDEPPGEETVERRVRVDGDGGSPDWGGLPGVVTWVDPSFFAVLGVRPVAGRLLEPGDVPLDPAADPPSVIVNMKFLERREMDPDASVGRQVWFTNGRDEPPGPWMEIVGVVPNIEASADRVFFDGTPVLYLPATPGAIEPLFLTIDLGSDPAAFTPTLRRILAEVDAAAILDGAGPLDEVDDPEAALWRAAPAVMVGISLIAIVLSTAALYALMSFTVAQRTREIGIRVALGGNAGRIVATVARRAFGQLAVGVALGAGFWTVLLARTVGLGGGDAADELAKTLAGWPLLLLATTGAVVVLGMIACLAPVLRGLRIPPVEALRAEV